MPSYYIVYTLFQQIVFAIPAQTFVHRTEEKNVLLTLMDLARIASRFGLCDLPELVKMEREIEALEAKRSQETAEVSTKNGETQIDHQDGFGGCTCVDAGTTPTNFPKPPYVDSGVSVGPKSFGDTALQTDGASNNSTDAATGTNRFGWTPVKRSTSLADLKSAGTQSAAKRRQGMQSSDRGRGDSVLTQTGAGGMYLVTPTYKLVLFFHCPRTRMVVSKGQKKIPYNYTL
ncbi:unnamed protein product [Dibothriocephalus latus]|uniref:Uncharacterized protein n=1 Tax=Dibothriocephalus latus TaxID=60516 RepID=A0A3P7LB93_DIBLA|nr:unnamed protein product [Dibothriocephalus latus]